MDIKGLLLPIFSLPNKYGIGDFGKEAFYFIDLLKKNKFNAWQILPLNPISYGHSPYQPYSSYAIEDLYISIDDLIKDDLLKSCPTFRKDKTHIDYEKVRSFKEKYFSQAFDAYLSKYGEDDLLSFADRNIYIDEYANFMAKKELNNFTPWNLWNENDLDNEKYHRIYLYHLFKQYYAKKGWDNIHEYAKKQGISIIGDIPFYVGYDSSDVYFNKQYFLLDENNKMTFVAGVSPDYFSEYGQRWGNPIYNFEELKKDNYRFIIDRIIYASNLYDKVRIDHFRAFDTYYVIPAQYSDAKIGEWKYAPGYEIFDELYKRKPNIDVIAEDLGNLRPEVYRLRDHYHLPGMNVLEFTINDFINKGDFTKDDYKNLITYIGTHDNMTLVGYLYCLKMSEKTKMKNYFNSLGIKGNNLEDLFLKFAFRKFSNVIISFVDLLHLNNHARINAPSTLNEENWTIKLQSFDKIKYYMKKEY